MSDFIGTLAPFVSNIITFVLGAQYGKKKKNADTDSTLIANVNATMAIYKLTYEQQVTFMSQKYTDLKINYDKCMEEIGVLKQRIKELENSK